MSIGSAERPSGECPACGIQSDQLKNAFTCPGQRDYTGERGNVFNLKVVMLWCGYMWALSAPVRELPKLPSHFKCIVFHRTSLKLTCYNCTCVDSTLALVVLPTPIWATLRQRCAEAQTNVTGQEGLVPVSLRNSQFLTLHKVTVPRV